MLIFWPHEVGATKVVSLVEDAEMTILSPGLGDAMPWQGMDYTFHSLIQLLLITNGWNNSCWLDPS